MSGKVDLAWCAGVFEGEGCIRINKPTRRNMGALVVSMTNTEPDLLRPFVERWPGHFKRVSVRAGRSEAWSWVIASRRAAAFLSEMLPYFRGEKNRARARLGIEFQAQKQAGRPRADTGAADVYAARQVDYYWRMRGLGAGRNHPDVVAALADRFKPDQMALDA